jgi:polysaccharide biosynthesis protein PslG
MMRTCLAKLGSPRLVLRLSCVAACLCFAASASAATVGINADITWGIPSGSVSQEVSAIQQAGVPWIRATIDLSGAEYYGPQLNMSYLSGIDTAVQSARNAGLNVLLELDRAPYWASGDPNKYTDSSGGYHWNPYWEYSDPQLYAQVVADVVNHYKAMDVHAYEVWNEPNNPSFWPSGVSAGDYVAMLKAAYPAIKAADPSTTVLMGGLENEGSYAYLQAMYNAGAKGFYDVANFHLYPGGDPTQCTNGSDGLPSVNSFCLLDGLRSEMASNGDVSPVWITELGWSTCTSSSCVTPQQQASYITAAYQLLANGSYSYVHRAFVYQLRDLYNATSNTTWGTGLGVMDRNFTPKPAYYALQSLTSASGGSAPPTVTLTSPTAGASIGSSVVASASASDPVGIAKVTFAIDGRVLATRSTAPYSATLSTKKLTVGSHVVTATAFDTAGRTASSSVTVSKGTPLANASAARRSRTVVSLRLRRSHARSALWAATGRVRFFNGARRSSQRPVTLVLQRRIHGSWHTVRVAKVPLHGDRYSRRLRLTTGPWRLWAECGSGRSGSRLITVV